MVSRELYHHGVRGMRWGQRRYQNADGSLTPAGQRRYDRDQREQPNNRRPADAARWVREDISRTRKLTDETSGLADKLHKANEKSIKNAPKPKVDLSTMSDKEMRDAVNRKLLEKQYNDLCNPPNISKGREFASAALENAGTVLGVASSALGIALAIKELTS